MILKDKKILLGVSSSIAIYKSLELIRLLKKEGADVFVVMTRKAKRLINPLLFSALSGNPTFWQMFSEQRYPHLELVRDIHLFLIAPATANIISKIANGIADDLLTTSVLACKSPIVIAPAMNVNMWEKKVIQRNLDNLRKDGFLIIEPKEGELGCGEKGKGRMAEPEEILNFIKSLLFVEKKKIKFIITGGATESSIDKIRIITNRASGLLSILLAEVCYQLGYEVSLILGRSEYYPSLPIKVKRAFTNEEMLKTIREEITENTCLIMNAAPCDYKINGDFLFKLKEREVELKLIRDIDILKELKDSKLLCKVGFSCDVEDELKEGERKLKEKSLSLCVINPSETIGSQKIKAILLFDDGKKKEMPLMDKKDFAFKLIEEIELWLKERHLIP